MPNWVRIKFTATGTPEAVKAFRQGIKEDLSAEEMEKRREDRIFANLQMPVMYKDANKLCDPVDFNRLIPMPTSLKDVPASFGIHDGYAILLQQLTLPDWPWLKEKNIHTLPEYVMYLIEQTPTLLQDGFKIYQNVRKYGYRDWYEWSVDNWGTKWNACDSELLEKSDTSDALAYFFTTAWSFPEPFFKEVAKQFPDITITGTCDEEGGFFHGEFTIDKGVFSMDYHEGYRKDGPFWHEEMEEEFVVTPPASEITADASAVLLTPDGIEDLQGQDRQEALLATLTA